MELIIIALLIILIFKEDIIRLVTTLREQHKEEAEEKPDEYKKEFDKLMDYSIEDAIKSKRSDING